MATQTYIATINDAGIEKLTLIGARAHGRQLSFSEDDEKSAHAFYRRYMRNFFGVVFYQDRDYSLYAPHFGSSGQRLGFQERA